jgi:choline dehydrogenase-like flavoprotein
VLDWPISYDDLEPYYARVEEEVGVSGRVVPHPGADRRSTPDFPLPPPLHGGDELKYYVRAYLEQQSILEPRTFRQDATTEGAIEETIAANPGLAVPGFGADAASANFADWPISYDDLEPWYEIAESELGVAGDDAYDWGSPRKSGYPMPRVPMSWSDLVVAKAAATLGYTMAPFPQARNSVVRDGRPQCCGNASCVPICPIQAKYDATAHLDKAIRAGAQLETEAVVNRIVVGPDNKIASVKFLRPDRSEGEATARIFVVACHAVETPKLLLMSTGETTPNGAANSSGQVGRNLMSQIDVGIQGLTRDPVYTYRGPVSTGGILEMRDGPFRNEHCAIGISPSNEGWDRAVGPLRLSAALIKKGLRGEALKTAIRETISRQLLIGTSGEMLPDDYNKVGLAKETDALGIPRPKIWFRSQNYTKKGLAVAQTIQATIMANLGATEVKQLGPIADSAIMGGTTRMGSDPKTSVVDANLRAHDHANLFIVGSQVFPSITANAPTLTVATLSARLGAFLTAELRG